AREAGRAVRAQRVHARHHLAHRLVRPVGCRAREAAGPTHHPRARRQGRAEARPRLVHERPHPSLPATSGGGVMTIGFDRDLYVLPFDHRGSFETKMFGWEGPLSAEQTAQIAAAKQVIYDGFK